MAKYEWLSTKNRYDPHYGLKQELVAADAAVLAAAVAADVVVTNAFVAADVVVTTAYGVADGVVSAAFAAADVVVLADAATAAGVLDDALPYHIGIAGGDETTDHTAVTDVATFRMPFGMTVSEVRATLTTAATGAAFIVDINEGGTSILDGKLTIDTTEFTSTTSSVVDVQATGTVSLDSGASGSVDGITVNAIEVMSGAESFDTSLIQTATNVAANITAHTSSPNYTAASGGTDTVTISAAAGTGTAPNGFVVVSSVTTIGTTDGNMASGVYASGALADTTLADDAEITIDVDQIGSTIAGAGLKVWLIGTKT